MCNLYSMTKGQQAIRDLARVFNDRTGNLPPLPGIFPDYPAPIVRNGAEGRELVMARWGMPRPAYYLMKKATDRAAKLRVKGKEANLNELLRVEPDPGVTNIRETDSKHWKTWLGVQNRCLVPFTSFSENEHLPDGTKPPVWFALDESRPLAFFAGIWCNWTSVRKVKEGQVTADIFGFLTTDANTEVRAIHPKAMPVILTKPEEFEAWMTADWSEACKLQRPLPDGSLKIVARGEKQDGAVAA